MKQLLSTRLLRYSLLPLVALVVVLAVVGFATAQTPTPDSKPGMGHHQMIPELQGIPPEQLFDHFRGSQFSITDAQGNPVVYQMTPGTVSGVSDTAVTVTPNGESTTMSFNITPSTRVLATPGPGSLQALVAGDKVVVLSKQGTADAVLIAKPKAGFHRGMM